MGSAVVRKGLGTSFEDTGAGVTPENSNNFAAIVDRLISHVPPIGVARDVRETLEAILPEERQALNPQDLQRLFIHEAKLATTNGAFDTVNFIYGWTADFSTQRKALDEIMVREEIVPKDMNNRTPVKVTFIKDVGILVSESSDTKAIWGNLIDCNLRTKWFNDQWQEHIAKENRKTRFNSVLAYLEAVKTDSEKSPWMRNLARSAKVYLDNEPSKPSLTPPKP